MVTRDERLVFNEWFAEGVEAKAAVLFNPSTRATANSAKHIAWNKLADDAKYRFRYIMPEAVTWRSMKKRWEKLEDKLTVSAVL